jgi:serine/threonine protein kinase
MNPADPAQRYQVLRKLDAGGMAEIFLAKSLSIQGMEKQVAIKRVLPSLTKNAKFIEMFLDEARLSISLNHANIVQVFDVSQSGGTYFIVMEYVDGFNVRHLFQRASELGHRIPVPIACYILIEVCKGLEHAHTKRDSEGKHLRIVHRDLSPPNVLLSRSGEVKITDFGLAKATSQLSRTDPGVVKGKYSYLSPEVTEGKAADLRADIFAAGIVLWELLANRRLFFGKTDVETVDMVRKADVPSLTKLNPAVSPQLEAIVMKALARDPRKRYTSAREMGEDLANHLARGAMKATSFDLAQTLDQLFGVDGASTAEAPAQRVTRIAALIDDEIANLSMLGFSKQVRGVDGSEPLDPGKLDLASIHRPRFDLSPVWAGGSVPMPLLPDAKERAPTLRAMEDVSDIAGLVRMLEGNASGALDWPDPGVTGGPRPATISTMRVEPAKRSSGLVVGLIVLALVGVGVGLALFL